MKTMTKKEARKKGMHKYYTGVPCKNGHLAMRLANSGACTGCIAKYARDYYHRHKPATPLKRMVKLYVYHPDDMEALKYHAELLNLMRLK